MKNGIGGLGVRLSAIGFRVRKIGLDRDYTRMDSVGQAKIGLRLTHTHV
jgi:hypothetical protein